MRTAMRDQPWGIKTRQGIRQSKSKKVGWRGAVWNSKEKGKRDLTLPQGASESRGDSHGEWCVWGEGKMVLVETVCVKSFQSRQEKVAKSKARVNQCLGKRCHSKHRKKNKWSVGKEENTQQFPVTSQGDEKGGERGIKSDSGDAKGGDSDVNVSERGKWSIAKEIIQLSFWLCIGRWEGEGTGQNVE